MNLSEILKKNEKKLQKSDFVVRKPEIARNDRPYSEFLSPQIPISVTKEILENPKQETQTLTVWVQPIHEENKTNITKNIADKSNQTVSSNTVSENTIVSNEYINLAGNEKKFMDYICENAIKFNDLEVGPIGIKEIIEEIGLKEKSIKQTINRLKNKNFLKKSSKRGKGGWRIFKINEKILNYYKDIVAKTACYIEKQTQPAGSTGKTLSIINKSVSGIPKEWEELDITGLDKFGFTKNHLIQLYQDICCIQNDLVKETLTIDSIQHSIYCFRWDLQHHHNELKEKYASPIKMFIGGLRKGRPYNSIRPETFKTPEQIEWELYHQFIEKQNKEREQIKQQSFLIEFEEWSNLLSEQEIHELLSEETKKSLPSLSSTIKAKIIKNTLLSYFENYVWPINYKKIISNKNNTT